MKPKDKIPILRKAIKDLNRMLTFNRTFLRNFVNFSLSQKPPHDNSWLLFDLDIERHQFWKPTPEQIKEIGDIKHNQFVYYPYGKHQIVWLRNTTWMQNLYQSAALNKERIHLSLDVYTPKLFEFYQNNVLSERDRLTQQLIKLENKGTSPLF